MATRTPRTTAARFVPDHASLAELAAAAAGCQGCELYRNATQTVFGEGPERATTVLVGEQPGDVEDRRGRPFVGPAGRLLDRALADAGIPRDQAYVTNAVKHFRWKATGGGKRRIHATPDASHIAACHPWLAAELAAVRPRIVVALGATAAKALFGSTFRLTHHRGQLLDWPPPSGPYADDATGMDCAAATIHPSAVLRVDPEDREDAYESLVRDLAVVARVLGDT